MNYIIESLEWDTEFFEVASALVELSDDFNCNDYNDLVNDISGYKFITFKFSKYLSKEGNWLVNKLNAQLVDVNIQFEKEIKNTYTNLILPLEILNNYERDDRIIEIAGDSFIYSRFFNDISIGNEKGKKVYKEWVRNSFGKMNKYFTILKIQENIEGFVLFSITDDILRIELICIDSTCQRLGLGSKLLDKVLEYAESHAISKIKVGTQINNIEAINFYFRNDFKITNTMATYHLWR